MGNRFSTTQVDAALGLAVKGKDIYKNSWEATVDPVIVEAQKELRLFFTQVLGSNFSIPKNFERVVTQRVLPNLKVLEQSGLVGKEVRKIVSSNLIQKEDISHALEIIENVRNKEQN
jgi:hypothetical protein